MMSTANASHPVPVPMCDIRGQYLSLKAEMDAAILRVLESGQVILGPEVSAFEAEYAEFCQADHAIGCADGTTALLLALQALDIGPGDEVIVPPFTFFATVGSVIRCGATPVFADIDPLTFNLDPQAVAAVISPRTRAIIPVHLFGQCAEMTALRALADHHKLYIIEDAAQSFGAEYDGQRCGTLGEVACFSFYPSKNVGTLGDAGMVTTNNANLAQKLVALRNHGSEVKYFHKYVGWNARIDAIHAAMLRVKLPHVTSWLQSRREAASRYDWLLEEAGLTGFVHRPIAMPNRRHTYNQYVIRVAALHRDALVQHLRSSGIGCDIYYPLALHQQECLQPLGYAAGDFPASEDAARTVLALPIFPEITEEQQHRVVAALSTYARQQIRLAG
ncbi:MAG: DegT/DnrJ/EryC1/StrS family aminotransferase [Bacteroidales bacterium]|nr:DegT/DnrJ/EryC1/StrS family aminotransferase [Bacteroidales bacterium]